MGTERFSGVHEQRLLLNSTAVILQNLSVTTLIIRQLKGKGGHKPRKVENHWFMVETWGLGLKNIFSVEIKQKSKV